MAEPVARIRAHLEELQADGALLTDPAHVRWSSGFTGSNALVLITGKTTALVTDARYTTQASLESAHFEVFIAPASLIEQLKALELAGRTVAFDPATLTVAANRELTTALPDTKLTAQRGWLDALMSVKEPWELDRIARAQELTDSVFSRLLEVVEPGMQESRIAAEIVYLHMLGGAGSMAFEPIVASGSNGALPHARPGNRKLEKGDTVVIDMGCYLDGYASDMTRTFSLGVPDDDFRCAYDVVLRAKRAAVAAAMPGMSAKDLDRVARDIIQAAGLGDHFVHSLGHGVGLRVHEVPRIAASSEDVLLENMVVTIEPGVYIRGKWGVRIEDLVVVRPSGVTNLTASVDTLLELPV